LKTFCFSALIYQNTEEGADLFNLHQAAWQSIWNDGEIQVDGNLELSKIIYGCLYYLSSSLPMIETTNIPSRQFYGLSPGGLAYGDYLMDYQGHVFWDQEV
jgi:trehalose/maltose hydrolase-like predicted phosphorylase